MTALTASHRQKVIERLRARPKLAVAYMQAAIEAGDQAALLLALRTVAEARGGMSMIAAKTGLKRESVSRALSATGNPRLSSLSAILQAAGLQIAVRAVGFRTSPHATLRRVALVGGFRYACGWNRWWERIVAFR